jgi:hypothetical protein
MAPVAPGLIDGFPTRRSEGLGSDRRRAATRGAASVTSRKRGSGADATRTTSRPTTNAGASSTPSGRARLGSGPAPSAARSSPAGPTGRPARRNVASGARRAWIRAGRRRPRASARAAERLVRGGASAASVGHGQAPWAIARRDSRKAPNSRTPIRAATVTYSNGPTPSRVTARSMSFAAIATSTSGRMNERRCTENHYDPFRQSFRQTVPRLPPEQPSDNSP